MGGLRGDWEGYAKLVDMTDEQWKTVLDVTLNGTFRMTRAALRHMTERRAGVIGLGGASIISRVMGIILAAVAVDGLLGAISDYFRLS